MLPQGNMYKFCYGYPFIVAMFKRRVDIWIVRVKFELDEAIIKDRFISNKDINHLRYFVRQRPMIVKI